MTANGHIWEEYSQLEKLTRFVYSVAGIAEKCRICGLVRVWCSGWIYFDDFKGKICYGGPTCSEIMMRAALK